MFTAILASVVLSNASASATDQEKDAAAEIYMTCLLKAASQIDHARASEHAVVAGIVLSCRSNLQHMKEVYSRGESSEFSEKISVHFDGLQQRSAERAVLIVRTARSDPSKSGS
jgi:hypothetical protein